jgi:cysteine desulfurase
MAIKGVAQFYGDKKKHIITAKTEHKVTLACCKELEEQGFDVTYLPV